MATMMMTMMMIMMMMMMTDDDHDDHEEHEEEESYQDIENFIVSWKNDIKFDNSSFTVTAGFSQNLRKNLDIMMNMVMSMV